MNKQRAMHIIGVEIIHDRNRILNNSSFGYLYVLYITLYYLTTVK